MANGLPKQLVRLPKKRENDGNLDESVKKQTYGSLSPKKSENY